MVLPEKYPAARSILIDAQPCLKDLRKGASHQTHIPSRCPVSTRWCPPWCLLVYNPMNTLAIFPVISPKNPTVRWTLLSNLAISLTGGATSLQWMTASIGIIWDHLGVSQAHDKPYRSMHNISKHCGRSFCGFHSTTQNSMKIPLSTSLQDVLFHA
jgi:hypothetical protein